MWCLFLFFSLFIWSDKNPHQHIPLKEYSENLKEISRLLASAGLSRDKVIFITPPPIHEPAWEKECILKGNILLLLLLLSQRYFHATASSYCLFQDVHLIATILQQGSMLRRASRLLLSVAQMCWTFGHSCRKMDRWSVTVAVSLRQ